MSSTNDPYLFNVNVFWITPSCPQAIAVREKPDDVAAFPVIALAPLEEAWNEYKAFLKEKYPADEGKEWEFTCPHHQKIDGLLSGEIE